MAKKEKWEPCPRCGSNKVKSRGGCFFALVGICMISFGIWLLIIPPVGIGCIVIGFFVLVASPFMKGNLQCEDCDKAWKYPYKKEETPL